MKTYNYKVQGLLARGSFYHEYRLKEKQQKLIYFINLTRGLKITKCIALYIHLAFNEGYVQSIKDMKDL